MTRARIELACMAAIIAIAGLYVAAQFALELWVRAQG